jgi:IS5 family transposase
MIPKSSNTQQLGFYNTFEEQLSHSHSLYKLAKLIDWKLFEDSFNKHYSEKTGAPAKPIRRMVGLLILKHVRNISDESVVEQWQENVYYQYFCGEKVFAVGAPCNATELVHFRHRIGEEGIALILKESIRINGKDGLDKDVMIDTTGKEYHHSYR